MLSSSHYVAAFACAQCIPSTLGVNDAEACDFPRYNLTSWQARHGVSFTGYPIVPDHPAIFKVDFSDRVRKTLLSLSNLEAFLDAWGHVEIMTKPDYAPYGGHLANYVQRLRGAKLWTFREFLTLSRYTAAYDYHADVDCQGPCKFLRKRLGNRAQHLDEFHMFAGRANSTTLLVGGPNSGAPLHKHESAWQLLLAGQKTWYVLPPACLSMEMHNLTGPYVFPPVGWHESVREKSKGKRPLQCVQHPGEILYVPGGWWHATMNIGSFTISYGLKMDSERMEQWASVERSNMLRTFSKDHLDIARSTANWGEMFPFDIVLRMKYAMTMCLNDNANLAVELLEESLQVFADVATEYQRADSQYTKVLVRVAAFAHCAAAEYMDSLLKESICNQFTTTVCVACWRNIAKRLDPAVHDAECGFSNSGTLTQ